VKYHVVPGVNSRQLPLDLDIEVKFAMKALNKELTNTLSKLVKREPGAHDFRIFHLHDSNSMSILRENLANHDEIIIHAEGYPFLIGPTESGPYTLTPLDLARLLHREKLPDVHVTINLLSCNSATEYQGSNFAKDLSRFLHVYFQYNELIISGYTGFIEVKSNAKYAVSSVLGKSTKGTHASVDDAVMQYRNGEDVVSNAGRTVLIHSLSSIGDSWAGFYARKTLDDRQFVDRLEQQKGPVSSNPS
jgi:hypothetical protein